MENRYFPFPAVVGQEHIKTALLIGAVDPGIGGILIKGKKGTGKTTLVRAFARLLPSVYQTDQCPFHCEPTDTERMCESCLALTEDERLKNKKKMPAPFVELPLNATEDRLAGTLHIESALRKGERRFEPGLLAHANRGMLYVDEVNLLDDHLVDLLLDAAAGGINRVEREGISHTHPSRFVLIGTMNPEEGELRPQFLDRFGLSVFSGDLGSVDERGKVISRRMEFDADKKAFMKLWKDEESLLSKQISAARKALKAITVPESVYRKAARLSINAGAEGHRADIIMVRTAKALAALLEKHTAGFGEIAEAARYVLPHRMKDAEYLDENEIREKIDSFISDSFGKQTSKAGGESTEEYSDGEHTSDTSAEIEETEDLMAVPGAAAQGSVLFEFLKKKQN